MHECPQKKIFIMKTLIVTAALAAATCAGAGNVGDSFAKIGSMPGIETTDIPAKELGFASDFISEGKIIMLDSTTIAAADSIIATIPQEYEYMTITSDDTSLLMYGEETDSPGIYHTMLRVAVENQNMVLFLTGTSEMFKHIMN